VNNINKDRKKPMRQNNQSRRPRRHHNNSNNNRNRSASSLRHQNFDSNGPDVRVRGTAKQVYEKYQVLARDAARSGNLTSAENYLQHAEHYYRITKAIEDAAQEEQRKRSEKINAKQPDAPTNYYAPEGKIPAKEPVAPAKKVADEVVKKEDNKKPEPKTTKVSKPVKAKKEDGSSDPFFSLDEKEDKGSKPQKIVAQ